MLSLVTKLFATLLQLSLLEDASSNKRVAVDVAVVDW